MLLTELFKSKSTVLPRDSILDSCICVLCFLRCKNYSRSPNFCISSFEKPAFLNISLTKGLYMYLWVIMSCLIFQRKASTCHSYQTAQPIQVPTPVNKAWHFSMPQAQKFSKDLHKSHIQDILTKVGGC